MRKSALLILVSASNLLAAPPIDPRGLYFREDFRVLPPATPITQEHIANQSLTLHLYGTGAEMVKKSHHEEKADDPFYVWSGQCARPWGIALRKADALADLSGREARFRLATLNSARTLYFILKTPDGWIVSDRGAEPSTNWTISTHRLADLRWSRLDVQQIKRAEPIDSPTLNHVEEIGVTDLEPGEGSAKCSRLDWLEVWEKLPAAPIYTVAGAEGVQIYERDIPILFYRTETKTWNQKFGRADYVHPLWGLHGEILTEDFPKDHPHHRGVFWSWHQAWIGEQKLGDGWACQNFNWEVRDVRNLGDRPDSAGLTATVDWKAPGWHGGVDPFAREEVTIEVHTRDGERRAIDFTIALRALVPNLKLGGSEDEKGYGGFTARLPSTTHMVGQTGPATPRVTSVVAGPWMNFAGEWRGHSYAVEIMQHPTNPGFPQEWILRDEPHLTNMQNAKWPGREPVLLSTETPIVLRYRLLIHKNADLGAEYQRYIREPAH